MTTQAALIRIRGWCGKPYQRTPATRMGTGLATGEASSMTAQAATPDQVFESDPRSLRVSIDLRKAALVVLATAAIVAAALTALPGAYGAVSQALSKLGHADARWLILALVLEALSFLGHIVLFRAVF